MVAQLIASLQTECIECERLSQSPSGIFWSHGVRRHGQRLPKWAKREHKRPPSQNYVKYSSSTVLHIL